MKRLFAVIWAAVVLFAASAAALEQARLDEAVLKVNGTEHGIHIMDVSYARNTYVSLRDLSEALSGTDSAFGLEYSYDSDTGKGTLEIQTGVNAKKSGLEPGQTSGTVWLQGDYNRLLTDGEERKYYTYRYGPSGDLYMSIEDFAIETGVLVKRERSGTYTARLDSEWTVNLVLMDRNGYFDGLHSVILCDVTSGEVLFEKNADTPYPVASLTKLMTYLLAMQTGNGELTGTAVFSRAAQEISQSEDGVLNVTAGGTALLEDLVKAMFLASSNEAAVTLAEQSGSEEWYFVKRMNDLAKQLGMTGSVFYNVTGLPQYVYEPVPAKRQNRMSARDLLTLCEYLLEEYPGILRVTGTRTEYLSSLGVRVNNSNNLVYNIAGTDGLKTGTTNAAQYCLAATMDTGGHRYVVITLGAESPAERDRKTGMLLLYARQRTFD